MAQQAERLIRIEKVFTIGDETSPTIFSSISSATFDVRSRLVIADYKESVGLMFDARGREVGRFGRKGAGPGEYRAIDQLGWVGDTLWIYDGTLRRTTIWHAGKVLRTDGTYPNLPAGLSFSIPLSVGATGTQFGLASYSRGEVKPGVPGFLLYRRQGRSPSVETVMWLARTNSSLVLQTNVGGRVNQLRGTQPLDDSPIAAARLSGGFVVVDRPATAQRGLSNLKVRTFNANGESEFTLDFAVPAVEVSRAIRAEVRSRLCVSRSMPNAQRMCTDDEAERALWFPPVLAPASGATGCSDGSVWIRLADSPLAKFQEYQGFSSAGNNIGKLRLAASAHILDCRGDLLAVALRPTSSFEPYVTVYRMVK